MQFFLKENKRGSSRGCLGKRRFPRRPGTFKLKHSGGTKTERVDTDLNITKKTNL